MKPGYVEIVLSGEVKQKLLNLGKKIKDEDLTGNGREDHPHVTVRYGLKTDDVDEVKKCYDDAEPFSLKLTRVSVFEKEDVPFDVIKVDAIGIRLHQMHHKLGVLPHKDSFPNYKPHATIAYVKKGRGKELAADLDWGSPVEVKVDKLVFLDSERKAHQIELKESGNV